MAAIGRAKNACGQILRAALRNPFLGASETIQCLDYMWRIESYVFRAAEVPKPVSNPIRIVTCVVRPNPIGPSGVFNRPALWEHGFRFVYRHGVCGGHRRNILPPPLVQPCGWVRYVINIL